MSKRTDLSTLVTQLDTLQERKIDVVAPAKQLAYADGRLVRSR